MAISSIQIINRALARIGEDRLVSIDDTSVRAQTVRDLYAECRQSLIRSNTWNFAVRRAILSPDTAAPTFRWTYRHRKPQGVDRDTGAWLRTVEIYEDDQERKQADYKDEGAYILADVDVLYMAYIADVLTPTLMEPLFRECLALKLAAECAIVLSNSNKLYEAMLAEHERKLREAIVIDAIDDRPDRIPVDTWEASRFRGSSGYSLTSLFEDVG